MKPRQRERERRGGRQEIDGHEDRARFGGGFREKLNISPQHDG